jgi:hypothetical protein
MKRKLLQVENLRLTLQVSMKRASVYIDHVTETVTSAYFRFETVWLVSL